MFSPFCFHGVKIISGESKTRCVGFYFGQAEMYVSFSSNFCSSLRTSNASTVRDIQHSIMLISDISNPPPEGLTRLHEKHVLAHVSFLFVALNGTVDSVFQWNSMSWCFLLWIFLRSVGRIFLLASQVTILSDQPESLWHWQDWKKYWKRVFCFKGSSQFHRNSRDRWKSKVFWLPPYSFKYQTKLWGFFAIGFSRAFS